MNTDSRSILLRAPLERKGPLSLYEQLRSSIEMAIISGELPDGAPLPSVRRLAHDLGLGASTVVRVYRELMDTDLIRAIPKRGYFVSTSYRPDAEAPAVQAVRHLLDEAIDGAIANGVSLTALLQLCAEQVRQRQHAPRRVAVVGYREAHLEERVASVAGALAGLGVTVAGLAFEDLSAKDEHVSRPATGNGTATGRASLAQFHLFLVSVGETKLAAELLGPYARRIVPMTRRLDRDVRQIIAGQPEHTCFGIVGGSDALVGRIVTALRRLHPLKTQPLTTSIEHPSEVPGVLERADVVVLGSLAARRVRASVPAGKPVVTLTYVPDERTLARVQHLVTTGG